MSRDSLVSVCLPVYNAERWIVSAIDSVLSQTHERLELIISDGASVDATAQIVRSYGDPRIRLDVAPAKLGAVENYNRSIEPATGEYVKFLHADDVLEPTCIEEMVALAWEDRAIGLVFARRAIALEDPESPSDLAWAEHHANPHERFAQLGRVNEGRQLFRQMLEAGFEENWIGEPSSVLVTRECLVETGLFNPRLRQVMDLELWLRVMVRRPIGFVDRVLSTYFHHGESITGDNARLGRDWLDRVWLLEGLLREPVSPSERTQIARLRSRARRLAVRAQAARIVRRRFSLELADYAAEVAAFRIGRASALHPDLVELDTERAADETPAPVASHRSAG